MADQKSDREKKPSAPERPPPRTPTAQHASLGAVALPAVAELGNRAALSAIGKLGTGAPLEPTVRRDMERRFDTDFSSVRVHGGPQAANLATQHHARAFTIGHDIVFGKSELAPSTTTGQRLIAHELTHVRQQELGRLTGRAAGRDATEADADRSADAAAAGAAVKVSEAAPLSIQKDEPTFSADITAMAARVAIVNDGGDVTGTLDGHPILRGVAGPDTKVGVGVFGNTVRYSVDEFDPDVHFTADAPAFCTQNAPGWTFLRGGRIQEHPIIIDPFPIPPPQKPKPPKAPPKPAAPPKPKSDIVPVNFPLEPKEPEKNRLAKLRASMLLGHDNLDQQLADLSDSELGELTVDERGQLLDWLNYDSTRAQDPLNQNQMLRLLGTTPDSDARPMIDALRANDAALTKMMLTYMDWQHKRELHKSLQLLYNTSMFNGFTIDDLKLAPVIPMKPGPLDGLDRDQLELTLDGKVRIKPKLDPFGRDEPKPLDLAPFGSVRTQTLEELLGGNVRVGPSVNLFGQDDSMLRDLMPKQSSWLDVFPYKPPRWPIFGRKDALTDFIQGAAPSAPSTPLSFEGEQRLARIKKEMTSWSTSGGMIGDELKAASPLERQAIAERLGDEGMTKLFASIDPMDAAIIGSLGPIAEGRATLTDKRVELMAEVSGWLPRQRTAIYMWMLGTMSNDEARALLSKLAEERFLNSTLKPIPGITDYLKKRGIDLDSYQQPGGVGGAAIGVGRFAKKIPGTIIVDPNRNSIDSLRIGRIPEPFQTMIRNEGYADADSLMTPGRIAQGGFSYLTLGISDIPFGLYSAGEGLIKGSIDIAHGDTTEGAEKIAPAALMIVLALVGRGKAAPVTGEIGAAEVTALEQEGLLSPKGPGQFSLKSHTGPLSPAAARVEAVLKVNPNLAAASGALVDELGGIANVEKAAKYMQGSSAATRLVIKHGTPGLKALVAAEGDVAAANAMLDGGTIPKTPLQLPAPKGPLPPVKPGMSTGERAEQAALDQARPGSTLLPDKSAGYDGTNGSTLKITGQSTRTVVRNGVKVKETVVDITVEGGEAIQIKTVTGIGTKPIVELVVDNVRLSIDKAWKQANGELAIKASPQPLPGQPTVFPRVNIQNPDRITVVVNVPANTPFAELAKARASAEAWVKLSDKARGLAKPIDIVVQYER